MIIHHGIDDLPLIKNAVVTSGTFDGVHLGHRQILKRLQQIAQQSSGESVVLTFWPHPRLVLYPEDGDDLKLLNTFDEKAILLADSGIDHLIRIPFTKEFSQLSSQDFIQQILIDKLNTKKLVIGYDHKFGRNREGSFEHLKANAHQYGFDIEEIPRQDIEEIGISSTLIRNSLLEGKVEVSNQYLSSSYTLTGEVIEGDKLGRTIGFPTANISVANPHKLIPAIGVYAVKVLVNNRVFKAMLNIGYRPTVDGSKKTIETHLFDFKQEIYGQSITIQFVKRIRDEFKFSSKEALKEQLTKDKRLVIDLLKD
jgi:riboflavin kinase/FMN adenylyltransferase